MTDENQNGYRFFAEEGGGQDGFAKDTPGGDEEPGSAPKGQQDAEDAGANLAGVPGGRMLGVDQTVPAAQPFSSDASVPPVSSVNADTSSFSPQPVGMGAPGSSTPPVVAGESTPASFPPPALQVAAGNTRQKKKRGRGSRFLLRTAKIVGTALLFGLVASGAFLCFNGLYYRLNPAAKPTYNADSGKWAGNPNQTMISHTAVASGTSVPTADVSSIVDGAMPSLVSISCTFRNTTSFFGYLYEGTSEGSGSGIIVGKNDKELLIATNNHVVDDAITTTVTFLDGSQTDATVRGTEEAADLAIVSVPLKDIPEDTLAALTTAVLGDSDNVKVGQMVIAIGNSLGYGQTTTVGYLSAKEREVSVTDSTTGKSVKYTALQVDAAINPGNSGGALLDTDGKVIGINSAKLSSTNVEGIGYAIPINNAIDILTELMNREILTDEEKGYLGINLSQQEITDEIAKLYGFPRGVYVAAVVEGGAADKAGILSGDIITAVNGSAVTARTQLQEKVNSYRCGTEVTVTLARLENGEYIERDVAVVLGSKADFE